MFLRYGCWQRVRTLKQIHHEDCTFRIILTVTLSFSTGGLIALGLVTQSWTMEDCLCHFERICSKAFPRHNKRGIPVLAWIRDRYKPKPETTAFEIALKGAFPETQHLFGDPRPSGKPGSHIKMAVTATSSAGRTVLLGNYNRYASKKRTYLVLTAYSLDRSVVKQFAIISVVRRK